MEILIAVAVIIVICGGSWTDALLFVYIGAILMMLW